MNEENKIQLRHLNVPSLTGEASLSYLDKKFPDDMKLSENFEALSFVHKHKLPIFSSIDASGIIKLMHKHVGDMIWVKSESLNAVLNMIESEEK